MLLGFDEFGERIGSDAAVEDGGVEADAADAGADAMAPAYPLCPDDWQPPDVPNGVKSLIFALDGLRLVPDDDEPQGLDLDCTDTTVPDASSCTINLTDDMGTFLGALRDLEGGIDNAGKSSFAGLFAVAGVDPAGLDQSVRAGRVGMVLRVINVASTQASPSVRVAAYPAGRIRGSGPACDAGATAERSDGGFPPHEPSFDDVWCVDEEYRSTIEGGARPLESTAGWIRDGFLFAKFDELPVPIYDHAARGRVAHARLREVRLVARIVGKEPELRLEDAVIAGRWPMEELLIESFSVLSKKPAGGPCRAGQDTVVNAHSEFCPLRDIGVAAEPERCSAVSVGFAFTGYAVASTGEPGPLFSYEDQCGRRVFAEGDLADGGASDGEAPDGGTELFRCPGDVE